MSAAGKHFFCLPKGSGVEWLERPQNHISPLSTGNNCNGEVYYQFTSPGSTTAREKEIPTQSLICSGLTCCEFFLGLSVVF